MITDNHGQSTINIQNIKTGKTFANIGSEKTFESIHNFFVMHSLSKNLNKIFIFYVCVFIPHILNLPSEKSSVCESAFIGATGNSYEVRIGKLSPDKLRHKL